MPSWSKVACSGALLAVSVIASLVRAGEDPRVERNVVPLERADAAETAAMLNRLAETPGSQQAAWRGLRISADSDANALVIESLPETFGALESVIEALDRRRPQVWIEAVVLVLQGENDRATDPEPLIARLRSAGAFAATKAPATVRVLAPDSTGPARLPILEAASRLAATREDLQFVYAPEIVTADNERTLMGIPSSRVSMGGDSSIASWSWSEPRVFLGLTPRIHEGNVIELRVDGETHDIPGARPLVGSPLLLQQGEAVVLGATVREAPREAWLGIPVLGALPSIGRFFRLPCCDLVRTQWISIVTMRVVDAGVVDAPGSTCADR